MIHLFATSLPSLQHRTKQPVRVVFSIQAVNICGQDTLRSWRRECSGYLLVPWNTPTAVEDGPRGARVLKPSRLRGNHKSMNLDSCVNSANLVHLKFQHKAPLQKVVFGSIGIPSFKKISCCVVVCWKDNQEDSGRGSDANHGRRHMFTETGHKYDMHNIGNTNGSWKPLHAFQIHHFIHQSLWEYFHHLIISKTCYAELPTWQIPGQILPEIFLSAHPPESAGNCQKKPVLRWANAHIL